MSDFGNTATDTSVDNTDDFRLASSFVAPESGTITSMSARVRFATTTDTLYIGIYADSSGAPGARLAVVSASITSKGSITLETISGGTYAFTSGVTYWLAVAAGSGAASRFHVGLSSGGTFKYKNVNTLPDPFGAADGTDTGGTICVYVTYTPSGGGAPAYFGAVARTSGLSQQQLSATGGQR